MHNAGFVRNYEGVLRNLLERGHRIHVAYEHNRNKLGENVQVERLAAEYDNFTHGAAPRRETNNYWGVAAEVLRTYLDYLRYLHPRYRLATKLRLRVAVQVPAFLRGLGRIVAAAGPWVLSGFVHTVRRIERQLPPATQIRKFIQSRRPSVLLITPLVDIGSDQVDYIREASAAKIPTALGVSSWDNLTNKGEMQVIPDRVLLWNDSQKIEAIEIHGVPEDRVIVTGAQNFDDWFNWQPSKTREAFGRVVGLSSEKPFILYLGSSFFIAPKEAEFAQRWLAALRAFPDPVVANADVLIRPHPNNTRQWLRDYAYDARVHFWPKYGADPFAGEFKNDFFDSLYYSGVVVGINTSAQIEAAILGRVICTVRAPEFQHSQEGTLHFKHLAGEDGPVLASDNLEAHLQDLKKALTDPDQFVDRTRKFVTHFVRPRGLDQPAIPYVTETIEQLALVTPVAEQAREAPGFGTYVVQPLAVLMALFFGARNQKLPGWVPLVRPVIWVAVRMLALLTIFWSMGVESKSVKNPKLGHAEYRRHQKIVRLQKKVRHITEHTFKFVKRIKRPVKRGFKVFKSRVIRPPVRFVSLCVGALRRKKTGFLNRLKKMRKAFLKRFRAVINRKNNSTSDQSSQHIDL